MPVRLVLHSRTFVAISAGFNASEKISKEETSERKETFHTDTDPLPEGENYDLFSICYLQVDVKKVDVRLLRRIDITNDKIPTLANDDFGRVTGHAFRKRSEDGKAWVPISVSFTGLAIRGLVWHPIHSSTILVGSANGVLHQIQIVAGGVNAVNHGDVADYIHAMIQDGRQLVVAHGQQLSVIRSPFARKDVLGLLLDIPISQRMQVDGISEQPQLAQYTIARGIYFVDEDTLAATFFGHNVTSFGIVRDLKELLQSIFTLKSLPRCGDPVAPRIAPRVICHVSFWWKDSGDEYEAPGGLVFPLTWNIHHHNGVYIKSQAAVEKAGRGSFLH